MMTRQIKNQAIDLDMLAIVMVLSFPGRLSPPLRVLLCEFQKADNFINSGKV
jgi:hypothetical protein